MINISQEDAITRKADAKKTRHHQTTRVLSPDKKRAPSTQAAAPHVGEEGIDNVIEARMQGEEIHAILLNKRTEEEEKAAKEREEMLRNWPLGEGTKENEQGVATLEGHFELRELLGRGGFGDVYRAYDKRKNAEVAIKIVRITDEIEGAETLKRTVQEVAAMANHNHPNIEPVWEVGRYKDDTCYQGEALYFVMPLEKGTLRDKQDEIMRMNEVEILEFLEKTMLPLIRALIQVNNYGLHLDIKPENICIDPSGTPKIADFGIFERGEKIPLREEEPLAGTLFYFAPERLETFEGTETTLDFGVDLFSLALSFIELRTGETLYTGDGFYEIMQDIIKYRDDDAYRIKKQTQLKRAMKVPEKIREVLTKMIEANPDKRIHKDDIVAVFEEAIKYEKDKLRLETSEKITTNDIENLEVGDHIYTIDERIYVVVDKSGEGKLFVAEEDEWGGRTEDRVRVIEESTFSKWANWLTKIEKKKAEALAAM